MTPKEFAEHYKGCRFKLNNQVLDQYVGFTGKIIGCVSVSPKTQLILVKLDNDPIEGHYDTATIDCLKIEVEPLPLP